MLTKLFVRFQNEEGATALEYGILVAVIALIILVGVGLFGNALNDFFAGLSTAAPL